jgi:hypothetical protein
VSYLLLAQCIGIALDGKIGCGWGMG